MFFLFVFMSFSRIEPRLFKQQYFLKFDFYDIMKPIFSRSKFFFCVFASQENGRKFFFVFFLHLLKCWWDFQILTLFRMGRGGGLGKKAPYQFFPVTSTNVGFGPRNFLTFSFNSFATLVQNFKFVPRASPKLFNLNQDHPLKKAIFLVKSL